MRSNIVLDPAVDEPERLDRWIASQARDWREIAEVLLRAGRRLANEHAAGAAYDDVRVDHIRVGTNGDVTFEGLVRGESTAAHPGGPTEEIRTAAQSLQQRLAVSDAQDAAAYLAPERFRGGPATPASNQFSFAVVMYLCLFDKMPFDADAGMSSPLTRNTPLGSVSFSLLLASLDRTTFVNLAREILAGNVRPPDPGSDVPDWVFPIVRRALNPDSEERFPSLSAMLDAFEENLTGRRVPNTHRRRFRPAWIVAAGGVGLLLLLGVIAALGGK